MNQNEAKRGPIDFGIVTALNVECEAVRRRLESYETVQEDGDPHTYYYGNINVVGSDERYTVVVVKLLSMGNDEAVATAARLINRWQPANIIMVGIGGGVRGKVALGDVVVAEFSHYYELGKRTPKGEQRRPQQFPVHRVLLGRAQAYEATDKRRDIGIERPDRVSMEARQPEVHFGTIASGEKVIADERTLRGLLEENAKILAIAMEGAGVARAVGHQDPAPRFLEVRGISDFADYEKNDDWQIFAANAAAAFTMGFLRTRPLSPVAPVKPSVESLTPVLVIRAQSLHPIGGDEVLGAFDRRLQGRQVETVALDFTDIVVSGDTLLDPEIAAQRIADPKGVLFGALARCSEAELVFHGLAHIPLVILAGHLITDRQHVRLFDFHADTWAWPGRGEEFPPLQVHGLPERESRRSGDAVIRVSASYSATRQQTRLIVPHAAVEVDLMVSAPRRGVVRSEEQVRKYGQEFRQAIDLIAQRLPGCRRIHLFYAGPVALAFHLGQQISASIHPAVTVWNFRRGRYEWAIDLAAALMGEKCIVRPPTSPSRLSGV